jgi:hypothetical protein
MVRAFGYCNDSIDLSAPSRLCRGRERWLEGFPDQPSVHVSRLVFSGAIFSDDSARDARRGLLYSGVSGGALLHAIFPRQRFFAFCENGDPLALPPVMSSEEEWRRALSGGLRSVPAIRWIAPVAPEEVDRYVAGEWDGLAIPAAEGFVVGPKDDGEALRAALYGLVGFSEPEERPASKYNPSGIAKVLEVCRAVVLLHLDKHAPAMAIYTNEPLAADAHVEMVARTAGAFPVPFAIPPMLARWDRALYELRMEWDPARLGEFPVPPADDAGGRWSSRRRHFEEEEAVRSAPFPAEPGGGEE